jgi:hypothetical protein
MKAKTLFRVVQQRVPCVTFDVAARIPLGQGGEVRRYVLRIQREHVGVSTFGACPIQQHDVENGRYWIGDFCEDGELVDYIVEKEAGEREVSTLTSMLERHPERGLDRLSKNSEEQ